MSRTIDLIRASKLPSNMMPFAAKGALSVSPGENIEILVYLAKHNKIFGDLARITLAGWDMKASLAAASDPNTPREVLDYLISAENIRPKLLPALLENPSTPDREIARFAISASQESIATMLQSARVRASAGVLDALRSNPYLTAEDAATVTKLMKAGQLESPASALEHQPEAVNNAPPFAEPAQSLDPVPIEAESTAKSTEAKSAEAKGEESAGVPDEAVSTYLTEHAAEIEQEKDKPFQPVGGIVDLLGTDYFPVVENREMATPEPESAKTESASPAAAVVPSKAAAKSLPEPGKRDNSVQKINRLDVKGRIQLAMKGNKEERSILIRDGTKVVALAVLDAPKISDGEVEKFALQKNVLEAVLRQIPLKRRFMKNYIVVRNLVANPRTPLDLGLGLMKHLLMQDLKNISGNKEVSETVRKLALKMYKQKLDAANKK